jgi:hypothetical protein
MMKDFYEFAGAHPILTFLLLGMVIRAVVRLIPWSKKDEKIEDQCCSQTDSKEKEIKDR